MISHFTRSTTTDGIEADLAALWRDVARQGPVARAVMSNLIVYREHNGADTDSIDDTIARGVMPAVEDVVARHPCRLIVLNHQHRPADNPAPFAVTIGIVTFGPEGSRYGIEHIAVRSSCAEVRLPSVVRQLVRGDVPTSVWWMDDLSQVAPVDAIIKMGRQLVYDSRGWHDVARGMSTLASLIRSTRRLDLADLNWRRLIAVRRALRHSCDAADQQAAANGRARAVDEPRRGHARIVHRPGDSALAWLAAGWLASRLQLSRGQSPSVEEGPLGDVALVIEVGQAATALTAILDSHQVVVNTHQEALPLVVPVPRESDANATAAELRNLSQDICLHDAIEAAALLLQ